MKPCLPPRSLCSRHPRDPSPTAPAPPRPSPWPRPGRGPSARWLRSLPGPAPAPLSAFPRRQRRQRRQRQRWRPGLSPPHPPLERRRPRQASRALARPQRLFPWRRGAGPPRGAEAAQGAVRGLATPPRPPGERSTHQEAPGRPRTRGASAPRTLPTPPQKQPRQSQPDFCTSPPRPILCDRPLDQTSCAGGSQCFLKSLIGAQALPALGTPTLRDPSQATEKFPSSCHGPPHPRGGRVLTRQGCPLQGCSSFSDLDHLLVTSWPAPTIPSSVPAPPPPPQ